MNPWLPALLFLGLSFFFSGIEIAFLSANKLQVELSEKQGILSGKIMSYFVHRPAWFFGTTRLGKSVSLVLFSIAITQFFTNQLPAGLTSRPAMIILIIILSAILILITTESFSKSLFTINPSRVLHLFAIPFGIFF